MNKYETRLPQRAFVVCKDRSQERIPGKWVERIRSERPANKVALIKQSSCKKKGFKTWEHAKWVVERAERGRFLAQVNNGVCHRQEKRVYECFKHGNRTFHLTSLSDEAYNAKFEASRNGSYLHAA